MAISLIPEISNRNISFINNYDNDKNRFGEPERNENLLDCLKNIEVTDDGKPPVSTPSVFRRPIDFYNVLESPEGRGSLSKKFGEQWRKMITLLALNDLRGFDVRFKKIPLDNPPKKSTFLATCASDIVLPKDKPDIHFGGATWKNSIYVVILKYRIPDRDIDDHTQLIIGATSPTTLFFPAEDFDSILEDRNMNLSLGSLTQEEKKCVYDWLLYFKEINKDEWYRVATDYNNKVLKDLVNDFIKDLQDELNKYSDTCAKEGWVTDSSGYSTYEYAKKRRFRERAFDLEGQPVGDGIEKLDYTIKPIIDKEEWLALFAGLALNGVKDLGIKLTHNGFASISNDVIAKYEDYCDIEPVLNTAKKIGLDVGRLSPFEWQCVWQYLAELMRRVFAAGKQFSKQLSDYIVDFMSEAEKNFDQSKKAAWQPNRFTDGKAAILTQPNLTVFDFTVNRHVAAFYEDKSGEYGKETLGYWFGLLYLVALKDLRNINIGYSNLVRSGNFGVNTGDSSPLLAFSQKGYKPQSVSINDDEIALTCCDTLFAVNPKLREKIDDVFGSFWLPESKELIKYMKDISDNAPENPRYLYDYEIALLIQYLDKILGQLGTSVKNNEAQNGNDYAYLAALIGEEKERLSAIIKNTVANPSDIKLQEFYPISEFGPESENTTTLKFFYGGIKNGLFEEKLVTYDHELGPLVTRIKNKVNSKIIGERTSYENSKKKKIFYGELGQIYAENSNGGIEVDDERIILPFTYEACEKMYNYKPANNGNRNLADIFKSTLWYGLDYVETYHWEKLQDDGSKIQVYDVYCKHADIPVPMIKQFYSSDSEAHRKNTVYMSDDAADGIIPSVTVWPDVEIECCKKYYVNVTKIGLADCGNVKLPDFIEHRVIENEIKDIDYSVPKSSGNDQYAADGQKTTVRFMSYEAGKYPRMLRVNVSQCSGCIFTRAYSVECENNADVIKTIEDRKSYIPESHLTIGNTPKKAIIGMDFGTTNTAAYCAKGEDRKQGEVPIIALNWEAIDENINSIEPVNMLWTQSNYLTIPPNEHNLQPDRELGEILTSQRRWAVSSNKTSSYATVTSTIALYSLLDGSQDPSTGPFRSSNIYRVNGTEIMNYEKSILSDQAKLKSGMKWDLTPDRVPALRNLLMQFALMCCVFAVKKHEAKVIEIRASFPTSMSDFLRSNYRESLEEISREITKVTGITITLPKEFLKSESTCTGLACIYNKNGNFENAGNFAKDRSAVCIDIGGGSTDIAVVSKNSNNLNDYKSTHMSLPFAAQYILTSGNDIIRFFNRFFEQMDDTTNKDIFKNLEKLRYQVLFVANKNMCENLRKDPAVRDNDKRGFNLMTDVFISNVVELLKERGDDSTLHDFLKKLREACGDRNHEHMKRLSKIKMVSLALLYFVGLAVKKLIEDGQYKLYKPGAGEKEIVDVFLAGNGSRIFDWILIDGDVTSESGMGADKGVDKRVDELLRLYIMDALTADNSKVEIDKNKLQVNIYKSDKPKHESAAGLLYADTSTDDKEKAFAASDDIDAIMYEHGRDRDKFREKMIAGIIAITDPKNEDQLKSMDDDALFERFTELVNPKYWDNDDMTAVVAGFLESFAVNSSYDFNRVFPGIITPQVKMTLSAGVKDKIRTIVREALPAIREPARIGDRQSLPLAVRSFNGYAVLKYVTSLLKL